MCVISAPTHVADDKSRPLPADLLRDLLERLNSVMAEAKRLRDQVTRQLEDQRASQQQRLSPVRRRRARASKR